MSASKIPLPVSQYANIGAPVRVTVPVASQTDLSATEGSGTYVVVYTAIQETIIDHVDVGYDAVSSDGAVRVSLWKVPSDDVITDAEANTRLTTNVSGVATNYLNLAASTGPTYASFDFTGVAESDRTLTRGQRLVAIFYGADSDNDITLPVISMLGRTNKS